MNDFFSTKKNKKVIKLFKHESLLDYKTQEKSNEKFSMSRVISITVKKADETGTTFEVDSSITLEEFRQKCQDFFGIKGKL